MARTADLDKNPRVKKVISVTGTKFKTYKVELNDILYRKAYRGENIHCSYRFEERITKLNEQITRLQNMNQSDYIVFGEFEFNASTLSDAHDYINALLTAEGWHQYRDGIISAVQDEINKENEKILARDKEQREHATYSYKDCDWKNAIISGEGHGIMGREDWEINGLCGNTTASIAKSELSVQYWKDRELTNLKNCLDKLTKNIAIIESINVEEAQNWLDNLRKNASQYIETGVDNED